MKPAFAGY